MDLSLTAQWQTLEKLASESQPDICRLFQTEADRLERLARKVAGIRFDFSRLPLAREHWNALAALVNKADVAGWRDRMWQGAIVNGSESRAATHMQLRGEVRDDTALKLAERVRSGALGDIKSLIHIGIGGSALGPQLLLDALCRDSDGPEVYVAANIDGVALHEAFQRFDPQSCWLIVVSKSFATQETMVNLETACNWLESHGVANPMTRVLAVTAAPELARDAGVPVDQILAFDDSVGGRYSLWSAVGLPVAIRGGVELFSSLLDGANAMDRHFLSAPALGNMPMMAAMADVWSAVFCGRPTRAVFAYDERLRLLCSYLQQLEMESNGKSVCRAGKKLSHPTGPIVWGGTGTDAQHAVFQLLHQGTHLDPIEFLAVKEPGHALDVRHHRMLLANCFAQGAALMRGRKFEEALEANDGNHDLAAARTFPGNRGSSTILLDRLDAHTLGALLAFYEARTFTFASLIGINPFDQWGVELGKQMADRLAEGQMEGFDPSTMALMREVGFQA